MDPLCAYTLLRACWAEDVCVLGETAALEAPIFRRSARGGSADAYHTKDAARIFKGVAGAAGDDAAEIGGHSARIGGATDYRDLVGIKKGKDVLRARGRWRSDIYKIYTRSALHESLDASAGVADVDTIELEAIFAGFAEPA